MNGCRMAWGSHTCNLDEGHDSAHMCGTAGDPCSEFEIIGEPTEMEMTFKPSREAESAITQTWNKYPGKIRYQWGGTWTGWQPAEGMLRTDDEYPED